MSLTAKKVYAILKRQISDMEAKLNSPIRYRGTVATADLLPLNPDIGDMYNIESKSIYGEAGMNVAWNGVVWDTMGAPIDMSLYFTKEEAEAVIQRLVTEYLEKNPVKPGATTEQAQQIEQNKTDVASLKEETSSLKEDLSNKITKFYASNQGETHITDSDNGKIMDMKVFGKSSQDGTPSPENPVEIKSVVNPMIKVCGVNLFDQTKVFKNIDIATRDIIGLDCRNIVGQKSQRRYYLIECKPNTKYHITFVNPTNNIFIGIADKNYIGIKNIVVFETITRRIFTTSNDANFIVLNADATSDICLSTDDVNYEPYTEQSIQLPYTLNAIPVNSGGNVTIGGQQYVSDYVDVEQGKMVRMVDPSKLDNTQSIVNKIEWLLEEPQETDLTKEEITAFKALVTYYPTTNISVNSEQLDGYTVFNYPISMANGWNYVKQQLNDNRDYIYDMDLQSAEAYVNSEYAVALTELEV